MGLDQYLSAKLYLSKGDTKNIKKRKALYKLFPEMFKSENLEYIKIIFEAGYWRKAYHIDNWFIENIENNGENYYVNREELTKLLKICKTILKDKKKANELLPLEDEEYDEWYFNDLKDTIQIIEKCLKLPNEWEFEYHSG